MTIAMVTSSYPRFAGDAVATFIEPIAAGVAALGHEVHVVAPWTPQWTRGALDRGVHFHLYRYAPAAGLNTFGYAAALRADVRLRVGAIAVAPLALAAGWWRLKAVARATRASIIHAHWVIPGGVVGAAAMEGRPLVISLHGSDIFVAERHRLGAMAARLAFGRADWVTACSADLRDRAIRLGASPDRITVVPYGVDTVRFRPLAANRLASRAKFGLPADAPVLVAVGRLVEKKGFNHLVDAAARLVPEFPRLRLVIAGSGDLEASLRHRVSAAGLDDHVLMPGTVAHHDVPGLLAAADVAVVPSIRDDAGNVDGLPNTVLEMMASGTPLVATTAGGIGQVAEDGRTARLVPERDATALAAAIADLLRRPGFAARLGTAARDTVCREHSWDRVARTFDDIYTRVSRARASQGR